MYVSSKWKILYLEEAVREGQCWRPQRGSSPELSTRFFVPVCVFVLFFFTFILVRVDRNSEFSQQNS